MPLANGFLDSPAEFAGEPSFPLDVYFCPRCSLVQLLDVVDQEALFRNYIYVSGTSDTMAGHHRAYAESVCRRVPVHPSDLVVEIASNDGSLLQCFRTLGIRTLGVEPAANIAEQANAAGIATVAEFFNHSLGLRLREAHGAARAVIANNVLAHVDDPVDFLAGAAALVEEGLVFVEVPYLGDLVRRMEYDTIYHEHLSYFSATALARLFAGAGLSIVSIDAVPVHGGSLRVCGQRREYAQSHANRVWELCRKESAEGLTELASLSAFATRVASHRERLVAVLQDLSARGRTVAGYGAPAKGNTMLNYCRIGTDLLPYTVDRNSMKVGKYTPGMHIPVLPVAALEERLPDYVLVLAWNYADEVIRQQRGYGSRGGRFLIPIPDPMSVYTR